MRRIVGPAISGNLFVKYIQLSSVSSFLRIFTLIYLRHSMHARLWTTTMKKYAIWYISPR